jgi:UDP-glucose 4-epimerase
LAELVIDMIGCKSKLSYEPLPQDDPKERHALMYFNATGADIDNEIGEDHDPETHLKPLILDAASGRRKNVTVFGSDYDTADGTCIRDHVYD